MKQSYYLVLVSFFLANVQSLDPAGSVSINQLPAWSMQRTCGMGCLQNNYDGGADIDKVLGCTWNGCFCGTQYQAAATSILTSCWSAYCGDAIPVTADISTALSIYNSYCEKDPGPATTAVVATATVTTGEATFTVTKGTGVGSTTTVVETVAVVSPSSAINGLQQNSARHLYPYASCQLLLLICLILFIVV
jgi:hypothetical protein